MSDTKTPAPLPPLVSDDAIAKVMADQFKTTRDHVVACGAARSVRNIYEADRIKTREVVQALAEAAQAVVDRWDSPLWKDVPHTGEFIGRLRDALSPYTTKAAQP